jgi:hypothetical protein
VGRRTTVSERSNGKAIHRRARDESRLTAAFAEASREGSATEALHTALVAGIEEGILEAGARLGEEYLATLF